MLRDLDSIKWKKTLETIEALINLIDPNREKIRIGILTSGLIVIEHKNTSSTMRVTNVKTAITDITYFINNDPAEFYTTEMTPNENVVSNTR